MYKYLIYCSISAAIILSAKYLYQQWIKHNHAISSLKLDMKRLEDKVGSVELELKKNKGSISGGVTIPIVFQKKESFVQNVQKTVPLKDDLQSEYSGSSSSNRSRSVHSEKKPPSIQLVKEERSVVSSGSSGSSKKKEKLLDLSSMTLSVSVKEDKVEENQVIQPKVEVKEEPKEGSEGKEESTKKTSKKKALPDAKDFNNGQKYTDDQGVEYLCIVGKRGGHSWKKITI